MLDYEADREEGQVVDPNSLPEYLTYVPQKGIVNPDRGDEQESSGSFIVGHIHIGSNDRTQRDIGPRRPARKRH